MFADAAGGLLAAALFLVAGWAWSDVSPSLRGQPFAVRLGWAFVLGYAWTAGAAFALDQTVTLPLRRATFLTLALAPGIVVIAVRLVARRLPPVTVKAQPAGPRWEWWRVVAASLIALVCSAVAARVASRPVADWDGRMTWVSAARWFCAAESVQPAVLLEKRWYVSHPDYPPLAPVADCAAISFSRQGDGAEPFRMLYALMLPALLAVVWTAARRWAGNKAAWGAVLGVALLRFPAWSPDGGAAGTYSDLPLAALYGGGCVLTLRARSWGDALAGALLLAGAAWVKTEGRWLAIAALVACALVAAARGSRWQRRRSAAWIGASMVVVAGLALLLRWQASIAPRGDEDYGILLQRADLAAAVGGLRAALPKMARSMVSPHDWSILWWIAPPLLALGHRGWARRGRAPWLVMAAAPLALAILAYAVHPASTGLAAVTWNRFLVQALVPLAVLLALSARAATWPLQRWPRR